MPVTNKSLYRVPVEIQRLDNVIPNDVGKETVSLFKNYRSVSQA
jgi:hypothetical protein